MAAAADNIDGSKSAPHTPTKSQTLLTPDRPHKKKPNKQDKRVEAIGCDLDFLFVCYQSGSEEESDSECEQIASGSESEHESDSE